MKYRKTLNTMAVVFVLLILSCFPFVMLGLAGFSDSLDREKITFTIIGFSFFGANSSINPAIYLTRFKDVRQECKNLLSKITLRWHHTTVLLIYVNYYWKRMWTASVFLTKQVVKVIVNWHTVWLSFGRYSFVGAQHVTLLRRRTNVLNVIIFELHHKIHALLPKLNDVFSN